MISRRSRLKAVANLPIRRKPNSLQEISEGISTPEDSASIEAAVFDEKSETTKDEGVKVKSEKAEVEQKGGENVEDCKNEIFDKNSGAEQLDAVKVVANNSQSKKDNVINGPSKFGRRLKPTVCLPIRKERQQPDVEKSTKLKNDIAEEETVTVAKENSAQSIADNTKSYQCRKEISQITTAENDSTPQINANIFTSLEKELQQIENDVIKEVPERKLDQVTPSSPLKTPQKTYFVRPSPTIEKINRKISEQEEFQRPFVLSPRVRNISESSAGGKSISQYSFSQPELEVRKNLSIAVKRKRPKSNDLTKKLADARREFHRRYEKIKPDRSSLKMIDLIFYNPTTNPMESKVKLEKKEIIEDELLAEGLEDDPDAIETSPNRKTNLESAHEDADSEDLGRMPVPQVKIGLNGEIILDEKSLVIETTGAKKGREDLQNSLPVFEDRNSKMSYYCRKTRKTKEWSDSETKRFYKALNTIGTDFLLMQQLFPNRSRLELKNKFKREEKLNRSLIDKALNNPSEFDMIQLEKDLEMEAKAEEEAIELSKQQKKAKPKRGENRSRSKSSWLSREMVESDGEVSDSQSGIEFARPQRKSVITEKERIKKVNELDVLYEKYVENDTNVNFEETSLLKMAGAKENTGDKKSVLSSNESRNNITLSNKEFKSRKRKSDKLESAETNLPTAIASNGTNAGDTMDLSDKFADKHTSEAEAAEESARTRISRKRKPLPELRKIASKRRRGSMVYLPRMEADEEDEEEEEEKGSNSGDDAQTDESRDSKTVTRTKTITDKDFFQLLAANVKNMKESTIKVQVTEDYPEGAAQPEKKIEVIFDNVPSITLNEIQDQNVTVLVDFNSESEKEMANAAAGAVDVQESSDEISMSKDSEETQKVRDPRLAAFAEFASEIDKEQTEPQIRSNMSPANTISRHETSVIVANPNVIRKMSDVSSESKKLDESCSGIVENENVMLVVDESDGSIMKEYQYVMVEEQPVEEDCESLNSYQSIDVEDDCEHYVIAEEEATAAEPSPVVSPMSIPAPAPPPPPPPDPALVVCKSAQTNSDKMFLTGLSAGSFVVMASESPESQNQKKFSMYMISEKSQSDGTSILSSIPVMLPPELLVSLSQELASS